MRSIQFLSMMENYSVTQIDAEMKTKQQSIVLTYILFLIEYNLSNKHIVLHKKNEINL